jgi:glucose-6-phosphate 1-epimerase
MKNNSATMKLSSLCLLAASAVTVSGFGVAPVAFTSKAASRTSVILEASRNAQKIASRSAWAESRLTGGADSVAEGATAGLMTNDDGLEYVKLMHPSGTSSEVYLFGGDVTSYKDADGIEYIAVRPDAKMDGSKPISGGLSHCFPQVNLCFCYQTLY